MGNAAGKLTPCFWDAGEISRRHDIAVILGGNNQLDEGFGHSFCYIRPDQCVYTTTSSTPSAAAATSVTSGTAAATGTTFRIISGASISANTSTPLSTTLLESSSSTTTTIDRASSFESSPSFSSFPLQPIPRTLVSSGPILRNYGSLLGSGHFERGFLSGPIERGYMSGPIDRNLSKNFSGSLENRGGGTSGSSTVGSRQMQVSTLAATAARGSSASSSSSSKSKNKLKKWNSIKGIKDAILSLISSPKSGKKGSELMDGKNNDDSCGKSSASTSCTINLSSQVSLVDHDVDEVVVVGDDEEIPSTSSMESQNLQWAQGKAGEDRVHIVISEEHGWVFVGIYDGFNGPDAPDFLLSNLYSAVHKELKGLMMNESSEEVNERKAAGTASSCCCSDDEQDSTTSSTKQKHKKINSIKSNWFDQEKKKKKIGTTTKERPRARKKTRNQHQEEEKGEEASSGDFIKHSDVLKALSEALRKTEEAYLEIADNMVFENPELSLMGSCVLAMLMKGEDIYLMNVGDSRAVLGQKAEPDIYFERALKELERINKKEMINNTNSTSTNINSSMKKKDAFSTKTFDNDLFDELPNITAIQFTDDHNTHVKEEVERIRNEHPDDPCALMNDRVKGSLKVTRAFGAGFLKKPKWNDALLEMFRIDYVGTSPYLTCSPSLYHHKLGPRDKFLILSSDGLYQYFTNEEAVSQVEMFTNSNPEGDPAQHLIEELLFRAAKKAGMDFHELLDIPQGERRRYHDDVSIIVISLEGCIWRSSM